MKDNLKTTAEGSTVVMRPLRIMLLLLALVGLNIFASCNHDDAPGDIIPGKDTTATDTINKDTTKQDSSKDEQRDTIARVVYEFDTYNVPVVRETMASTFLGNVVYTDAQSLNAIKTVEGVRLPKTITATLIYGTSVTAKTGAPSAELTSSLLDEMNKNKENPTSSLQESSLTFRSIRALHLYGEEYTGLALDSILYEGKQATAEAGGVEYRLYSIEQEFGQIFIDPADADYTQYTFPAVDKTSMGIINMLSVGKTAYMIKSTDGKCCIVTYAANGDVNAAYDSNFTDNDLVDKFAAQPLRITSFSMVSADKQELTQLHYKVDMR